MKANELCCEDLMVEDYVKYKDGTIVQIARVGHVSPMDAPIYCHTQLEGYFPCQLDDISLIPLTAEILEKNGFQRCENEWYYFKYGKNGKVPLYQVLWNADELYLEIASYTSLTGEFNRMGVRFVHELMHALKLCGIDKTIKLH